MADLLPKGADTGLVDSLGQCIRIGSLVKMEVTVNQDFHGAWSLYEVQIQGIVPVLKYVESEKGEVLPRGYLAVPLSHQYDQKLFLFATDLRGLTPNERLEVIGA